MNLIKKTTYFLHFLLIGITLVKNATAAEDYEDEQKKNRIGVGIGSFNYFLMQRTTSLSSPFFGSAQPFNTGGILRTNSWPTFHFTRDLSEKFSFRLDLLGSKINYTVPLYTLNNIPVPITNAQVSNIVMEPQVGVNLNLSKTETRKIYGLLASGISNYSERVKDPSGGNGFTANFYSFNSIVGLGYYNQFTKRIGMCVEAVYRNKNPFGQSTNSGSIQNVLQPIGRLSIEYSL